MNWELPIWESVLWEIEMVFLLGVLLYGGFFLYLLLRENASQETRGRESNRNLQSAEGRHANSL